MLTAMSDERSVAVTRDRQGHFRAVNVRGGELRFGDGSDDEFTPVELLLTALAGCSAADVDVLTARRSEPVTFDVTATGRKTRDAQGGNVLTDLVVSFTVTFPDGEAGDQARDMLPKAAALAHDRLCTVSRTVEAGNPVTITTTKEAS